MAESQAKERGYVMNVVHCSIQSIEVAMVEFGPGELFCTSQGLRDALALSEGSLDLISYRHKDKLSSNCLTNSKSIEFFKKHRQEFGMKYVRGSMRLWSAKDMLIIARYSNSPVADEFMGELFDLAIANATKRYVPDTSYEELRTELNRVLGRLAAVEEKQTARSRARPALQRVNSAAGVILQAQKDIKEHLDS